MNARFDYPLTSFDLIEQSLPTMDKIKNLVNPGSKKDDEVMYGTGVSDDPVHSGGSGIQSSQGNVFI